MKKATFFTLLFLSLQNLSFAQPELNLKAGITNFWMKPNPHVSSAIFLGDHYGIEFKVPLKDSKFALSAGIEQHGYNVNTDTYYIVHHTKNIKYADYRIETYRSFPLLVYYRYLGLDLFVGYEFKMVQILSDEDFSSFSSYDWNEHAFVTGFDCRLGRKFSFSSKLYLGDISNRQPVDPNRIISRTSVGFSLKYNLFKQAKTQ